MAQSLGLPADREPTLLGRLRRAAGLTQEELADRSGLSVRSIRKVERGLVDRPRVSSLGALADALGLSEQDRRQFTEHYRRGEPAVVAPVAAPVAAKPAEPTVPAQLPPRASGFAGRTGELAVLAGHLGGSADAAAPTVVVLTGMPGIGKTALATEAGWRAEAAFADGQLYLDLGGADPAPVAAREALGAFLRALGVDPAAIPEDLAGRSALFRSRTAHTEVLVVLDNAASEDQVRPLLTSGPRCRTIITSRFPLAGLDAPARLNLLPLTEADALVVLGNTMGHGRVAAEPGGTVAVARACGGVPLALRIVGARAALLPHLTMLDLANRLADESRRLGELSSGDRSVRGSFGASFRVLSGPARVALGTLARLRVPTFATWLVAPLLDVPLAGAAEIVDELVGLNLLEAAVGTPDLGPRYRMHDLVRDYARGDCDQVAEARLRRAVGWSVTMLDLIRPAGLPRSTPHASTVGVAAVLPASVIDRAAPDPDAWFAVEWPVLVALADAALRADQPCLAGALLAPLRLPMARANLHHELMALAWRCATHPTAARLTRACARLAYAAAGGEVGTFAESAEVISDALPDLVAEADECTIAGAWYSLAWVRYRLGQADGALAAYRASLARNRAIADHYGALGCHLGLMALHRDLTGDLAQALRHSALAVRLAADIGDHRVTVRVLQGVAALDISRGEPDRAIAHLEHGLELSTEHGDTVLTARGLRLLADAHRAAGALADAVLAAQRSRELYRGAHRVDGEADALTSLGHTWLAEGRIVKARAAWTEALRLRTSLDQPVEIRELTDLLAPLVAVPGQ